MHRTTEAPQLLKISGARVGGGATGMWKIPRFEGCVSMSFIVIFCGSTKIALKSVRFIFVDQPRLHLNPFVEVHIYLVV